MEDAYYEFVAFPCGSDRYSMPLGVTAREGAFRVFKGAGLLRRLNAKGTLRLLSPSDPLDFYLSLRHELEAQVNWDGGCPRPDPTRGLWFTCHYVTVSDEGPDVLFRCVELRREGGELPPYSRVYGCLVELLVLLTKAKAGAGEPWYLDYAKGLRWCVERASRGDRRYVSTADEALRGIEEALRSNKGGA